jgi:O-antigen ligase
MLMVTILPLTIMPLFVPGKFVGKLKFFLGTIFMLVATIETQSRGGFIGLIAIMLCIIPVKIPNVSILKKVIIIFCLAIVFFNMAGVHYMERIRTIRTGSDEGSGRLLVWKRALIIATAHPLLGVGPNAFLTAYGDFLENNKFPEELSREFTDVGKWQTVHNTYLLVLLELGIPGLILFLIINFLSFKNLRYIKKLNLPDSHEFKTLQVWSSGLIISLVGFLTCGMFLSQSYNALIYLIFVMSCSMVRIIERSLRNAQIPTKMK